MVGMRRFELPTPWPRDRCATRLRYIPTLVFSNESLYHFLGFRVVLKRSVLLFFEMAKSALVFPFAWRCLLLAFQSSHSLTCFCKFLISSPGTSIILSLSDELFIVKFPSWHLLDMVKLFYHHFTTVFNQTKGYGKLRNPLYLNGRDEKIWTSDPLTPRQVRYQAALHPDNCL